MKSRSHLESVIRSNHGGAEWKPKGSVHEGAVPRRMHEETPLLAVFADQWDGKQDPRAAFAALQNRLSGGAWRN